MISCFTSNLIKKVMVLIKPYLKGRRHAPTKNEENDLLHIHRGQVSFLQKNKYFFASHPSRVKLHRNLSRISL